MQENANKNILSCVRVKNVEYPIKMLSTHSNCQITVKDLYKKTSVDEYTFDFDRIFETTDTIDDCYRFIYKNCLAKAFDGINCTVVTMGVDGSGKTYTLLGDYNKQFRNSGQNQPLVGVISQTVQAFLQKASDLEDVRDVVLYATFYEVHLDKIRDLCNGLPTSEFSPKLTEAEQESMEIMDFIIAEDKQEELKRLGMVKNGTVVRVRSVSDLETIFNYSIKARERHNLKTGYQGSVNECKSHLIFNLNVRMKDRENPNFPPVNSLVQFVRFGGTERVTKSISNPYKGEKYQESILINSDLANLAKVVYSIYSGQKTINYDESKLIKLMRLTLNNKSSVALVACLNPNEATFEDSLNALAHLERCKNYEETPKDKGMAKKPKETEVKAKTPKPGKLNQLQHLQDEIQEKKNQIDLLKAKYKRLFDDISKELNLPVDVEKIIHNDNAKEWRYLHDQNSAFEKWSSMELFEKQLDKELKVLRAEEDRLRIELKNKEYQYR